MGRASYAKTADIEQLSLMTFVALVPGFAIQPEASWNRFSFCLVIDL